MNFTLTYCFLRRLLTPLFCFLALAVGPSVWADGIVPGHVLMRLQPGANGAQLARDFGTTIEDQVPDTQIFSLRTPNGSEKNFASRLKNDRRVVWAETDTYVESPEHGQTFHFAFDVISRVQAQGLPTNYVNQNAFAQVDAGQTNPTAGAGVIVAILDTGATFDHPALAGAYLPGYNAVNPGLPPMDVPDGATNAAYGHGTMIAGVIARLAPGAKLLPIRVMDADGVGTMLDVTKGIYYALAHGARVLNMSFGSCDKTGILDDALKEVEKADVVMVASAGNDGTDKSQYPADGRGALAVASVEADNRKSPYSNYGSWVRVVAPGSGIRSTYANGGYASWSGTSFAAPFVSAEVALMLSVRPSLTSEDVTEAIQGTCRSVDSVNPAYRGNLGKGLIDIGAAVRSVIPFRPTLTSVTIAPARVQGGQNVTGTVMLSDPAPVGGLVVALSSNTGYAVLPASVIVPAGQSRQSFSVQSKPVSVLKAATITARCGVTKTASLLIDAAK